MYERILQKARELVRKAEYVITLHAEEEASDDGLTALDVEQCVLTGQVVTRQKDRRTDEWKYLVRGRTMNGDSATVVVKIGRTRKLVVITVYLEE